MSLKLIEAPTADPFDIGEFRAQVLSDSGPFQESRAIGMLKGQAEEIEGSECYIQLITAQYELRMEQFPFCRHIEIPRPPLQSVDSITYIDTDGVEQTFGTFEGSPEEAVEYGVELSDAPEFGRIYLRSGYSWPSALCQPSAVRIRFTCGFGDSCEDIPENIKNWIYVKAASLYNNREGEQIGNVVNEFKYVDRLLDRWRARKLAF